MVELKKKLSTYWWWLDSQNNGVTRKSPWLESTLAELDEKTESMLNLIEEDADSFAQRAEMYYKKRPQLINIIEDFYRAHRSLALRYDQHQKPNMSHSDKSQETAYESRDSNHDQDPQIEEEESSSESNNEEMMNLREEIVRLKEENKVQKELVVQKDEEKREAIRQLSLCVDLLIQDNLNLKKEIVKDASKKQMGKSFTRVCWR